MLDPALRALLLFMLSSPIGPSAKVEDNPPPLRAGGQDSLLCRCLSVLICWWTGPQWPGVSSAVPRETLVEMGSLG